MARKLSLVGIRAGFRRQEFQFHSEMCSVLNLFASVEASAKESRGIWSGLCR